MSGFKWTAGGGFKWTAGGVDSILRWTVIDLERPRREDWLRWTLVGRISGLRWDEFVGGVSLSGSKKFFNYSGDRCCLNILQRSPFFGVATDYYSISGRSVLDSFVHPFVNSALFRPPNVHESNHPSLHFFLQFQNCRDGLCKPIPHTMELHIFPYSLCIFALEK
jgi:hypothetical protein